LIIGIDPGFSGAIAFLHNNNKLIVNDMPLVKINNRKQVDCDKINELIKTAKINSKNFNFAAIEDVHSMPGQGVASTFRFGYNAGILLGILKSNDIKVLRVRPTVWKSALGLSRKKSESLMLAKKIFPYYKTYFNRAKDDGRAEAALLAYYAKQSFG